MNKDSKDIIKQRRRKVLVIYIYVILTISMVVFALLVATQSFFNPLNFVSDSICYLERSEYNNPMIIVGNRGDAPDKTYTFNDKKNLYAMFVYMQQSELVEIEEDDLDAVLRENGTTVFTIYSRSVSTNYVFKCYYLGHDSDYIYVECMPDYPNGKLELRAISMSQELKAVMKELNNTCLNGLEAQ